MLTPEANEGPTAALPTQNLNDNESATSEDHSFSGDHLQNPRQNSGRLQPNSDEVTELLNSDMS